MCAMLLVFGNYLCVGASVVGGMERLKVFAVGLVPTFVFLKEMELVYVLLAANES